MSLRKSLAAHLQSELEKPYAQDDAILQCGPQFLPPHLPRCAPEARQFAHQMLYTYPYKDVPTCWRRLYEDGSCWAALDGLENAVPKERGATAAGSGFDDSDPLSAEAWLDAFIETLDMALIMTGGPGRKAVIDHLFAKIEQHLEQRRRARDQAFVDAMSFDEYDEWYAPGGAHSPKRRRRVSSVGSASAAKRSRFYLADPEPSLPDAFPEPAGARPALRQPMRRFARLSPGEFQRTMEEDFSANDGRGALPFVVTGAIEHWPAMRERPWSNPKYLMERTLGGRRLVPVEIGRSYTDEGWGQQIITFRRFLEEYMFDSQQDEARAGAGSQQPRADAAQQAEPPRKRQKRPPTGYLAQHDLFAQIPALRRDICIPDYCYSSPPTAHLSAHAILNASALDDPEADPFSGLASAAAEVPPLSSPSPADDADDDVLLNAWLGPARTISSLHTDPHHNVLAQVVGAKYARLYAPDEAPRMYPRGLDGAGVDMGNTSRVDLDDALEALEGWRFDEDDTDDEEDDDDGGSGGGDAGEEEARQRPGTRETPADEPEPRRPLTRRDRFVAQFPEFAKARYQEAVLGPGDCLFIPRGWWHYVRSLSPSFSVSFWWD